MKQTAKEQLHEAIDALGTSIALLALLSEDKELAKRFLFALAKIGEASIPGSMESDTYQLIRARLVEIAPERFGLENK